MVRSQASRGSVIWPRCLGYGLLAWIAFFVLAPSSLVILYSLQREMPIENSCLSPSAWSLIHYESVWNRNFFNAFLQSISLSAAAACGCLLLAYPFVWIIARRNRKEQAKLLLLAFIPFITNAVVKLYGLRSALHLKGPLNQCLIGLGLIRQPIRFLYGYWIVVIGLIELFMLFMIFPLWLGFARIPSSLMEAAQDLGANEWQRFWHITLPLTLPSALNGWLMVFFPAMGSFYVADLLGGSKQMLLGNLIKTYGLVLQDWPKTCALSLVVVLLMTTTFGVKMAIQRYCSVEPTDWI